MSFPPSAELPPEIQREPLGSDGVRYVLPRRPAHVRKEGLFLQIVGLILLLVFPGGVFTVGALCAVESFRGGDAAMGWFGVALGLFSVVIAYFIVGIFLMGWFLRAGDCEILVEQGEIRTTERFGFLRLSQSGLLEQVRRLVIEPCDMTKKGRPIQEGQRTELAGLRIELTNSRPIHTMSRPIHAMVKLENLLSDQAMEKLADTLSGEPLHIELNDSSPIHTAMAYPRPWVEALAREFQRLCASYQSDESTPAEARAVPVEEELEDTPDHFVQREVLEQPASSPILTARFSGGVLLHVPPVGLLKKGNGRFLFWFSFPWFGFTLLAPASWVVFALFGAQLPAEMIAINAVGMVLTLGVGTASLLAGINLARCQATLVVAEGQLLIVQMGPFDSKRVEWAREAIATIGIGYIGLKVQGVPVVELQVQPIDGGRFGILAGRDRTELEWLATTLRRELQVPPPDRLPTTEQS